MVIFYMEWKKYNEIELTKNKMDLNLVKKWQIIHPPPNRTASKPNVMPWQILYCTTDSIPVNLMFHENFPTNTQVWNRLRHRNDFWQRRVIRVTHQCYNSNPYMIRDIGHQEVKWSTTCGGWANNQLIATGDIAKSKAATQWWFEVVESNHSWWSPFKSPTNTKEAQHEPSTCQGTWIREPVTPTHNTYLRRKSQSTTVYHTETKIQSGN